MSRSQHLAEALFVAAVAMGVWIPGGGEGEAGAVQAAQEFNLTADQLRLIRELRVIWVPLEAGGPTIDGERPFGSLEVAGDMARILGHPGGPAGGRRDRILGMPELPEGLLEAVEVLIDAGKLRPGSYTIRNAGRERIEHGAGLPLDGSEPAIPAAAAFQFEVTPDHLKLFAHARFRGPGFNFKRPYGDMTFYELDMADALGVPRPPKTAGG